VLSLLTKLKQVCNHPAHYLKQEGPLKGRSGKLERSDRNVGRGALRGRPCADLHPVRGDGPLLQRHLVEQLKTEVLFLARRDAGAQRDQMVQAFQVTTGRRSLC
jgi:hypothetical protein